MSRTILLSRQIADAEPLASELDARRYKPLIRPAIDLLALPQNTAVTEALKQASVIALPSPNAARFAQPFLTQSKAIIWAQGKSTALALGPTLSAQVSPGIYADDLAEAIAEAHPGATVTICCGNLSRPRLAQALSASGCSVEQVELYENRCPRNLAFEATPLRAAIYFSPSAANRHVQANPWLRKVPAIAVGETTAQALQSGDFERVIQAPSPAIDDLIAVVESL